MEMTGLPSSLLIVDDEPYILNLLAALLKDEFEVLTASSAEAARRVLTRRDIDLIVTDQKMPHMTGVQLLEWVRHKHPTTVRLLMTGFAEIEAAAEAINRGHIAGYIFKPWQNDELRHILREAARTAQMERSQQRLLEALRHLNLELEQQVRQRERELEEARRELVRKNLTLEKESTIDPLTGLPNRRAMARVAEAELRRRERYHSTLCLGLIDVDHFKRINTRYLHPGGDQVLIGLARTLPESLRGADSLGRIGGEEFQIIAPETNLEGAKVLGERIRCTVEGQTYTYQGKPIGVTVSIGMAVAEAEESADYEQLARVAAEALRRAKRTGRNRCVVQRMSHCSG
jgi:diguanylate cyclase (GGDEF)-like protein